MKVYVDSGIKEYCIVFEGDLPVRMDYILDQPKTHNEAEYQAVSHALEMIWQEGKRNMEVLTDSKLVVEQVAGRYKVNKPRLAKSAAIIRCILKETSSTLSWIPREENLAGIELEKKKRG